MGRIKRPVCCSVGQRSPAHFCCQRPLCDSPTSHNTVCVMSSGQPVGPGDSRQEHRLSVFHDEQNTSFFHIGSEPERWSGRDYVCFCSRTNFQNYFKEIWGFETSFSVSCLSLHHVSVFGCFFIFCQTGEDVFFICLSVQTALKQLRFTIFILKFLEAALIIEL